MLIIFKNMREDLFLYLCYKAKDLEMLNNIDCIL